MLLVGFETMSEFIFPIMRRFVSNWFIAFCCESKVLGLNASKLAKCTI